MGIKPFVGVEFDGVPMSVDAAETLIDNQLGALIDKMGKDGNMLSGRQRLALLDQLKRYREPLQKVFDRYGELIDAYLEG